MRSTFSSNLVDLMSQSKHYQDHRRKVERIMNKQIHNNDVKRIQTLHTLQNFRLKAVSHNYKEKQSSLLKQNDMMFQKLLKVNNRKNQSLSNLSSGNSFSHKNLTTFKKNLDSITKENNTLAQKLVTARSNLSQKKLMPSYKRHLQVKQRLKKYEFDQDFGVIPKKLKSLEKIKFVRMYSQRNQYIDSSRSIKNVDEIHQNQEQR